MGDLWGSEFTVEFLQKPKIDVVVDDERVDDVVKAGKGNDKITFGKEVEFQGKTTMT